MPPAATTAPAPSNAHTYARGRRRQFNVGRVLVLNAPPCPIEVRVDVASRDEKSHHDHQHDGHVQARVLDHRGQRAAEKQADVQRDNLIPPVPRPEVTREETQRRGSQGLTLVHFSAQQKHFLTDTRVHFLA